MNRRLAIFIGLLCVIIAVNAIAFAVLLSGKEKDDGNKEVDATPSAAIGTLSPTVYEYSQDKLTEGFSNPTNEYRLHMINHGFGASGAGAKATVKRYISQGVGGVVSNVAWNEEYLDAENAFTNVTKAFSIAESSGLKYWLYDEMGYPSGNAGGRTTIDNPEYVAKGLVWKIMPGDGMTPVTITKPDDVTKIYAGYALDKNGVRYPATVTDNEVTFAGTEGSWTLYMFCEKKLYEGTHAETNGWGGENWLTRDYLNLMDKDAVQKFIDITYKAYASNVEQFKNVVGIFTDEPSLMECYQNNNDEHTYAQISWVDELSAKFKEMHGYDINEKLNWLFYGNTEEAKTVRMNYRQTVAELVSQNYFGQISDFCDEYGVKSSGHLLLEESISHHVVYYGNLMQCIREMGAPGVDILTADPVNYLTESYGPYFMAPKYVASAARLAGKSNLVMVEICPVDKTYNYTDETTYNALRGTLDLIFFAGVNHINSYVDMSSLGKRVNEFTDYFGRLSYMTRNSSWNSGIGLYYPIETVQMNLIPSKTSNFMNTNNANVSTTLNKLTLGLYKNQMDCNMVDDQFILEADIRTGGYLEANGIAFSVMLMPSVEALPLDVLNKLTAFEQAGGKVIWVGSKPTMGDTMADHAKVSEITANYSVEAISDELFASIKSTLNDPLKIDGADDVIFVSKYSTYGTPMYWLLNNSTEDKQITVSMDGNYSFDIYNPMTGEITSTGNSTSITLSGYTTQFLIVKNN